MVNPWNARSFAAALLDALNMSEQERAERHAYAYRYCTKHSDKMVRPHQGDDVREWRAVFLDCPGNPGYGVRAWAYVAGNVDKARVEHATGRIKQTHRCTNCRIICLRNNFPPGRRICAFCAVGKTAPYGAWDRFAYAVKRCKCNWRFVYSGSGGVT